MRAPKVNVGLSMLHLLGQPFSSLCRRLQEITVDRVEIVDDGWHTLNNERVKKLKKIGESRGFSYTLHAPFASMNIAAPSEAMRNFVLKRLERSFASAGQLGCHLVVFHPGMRTGISSFYPGLDWKRNVESVQELLRISRRCQVRIAIENCPEPYGFLVKSVDQFSAFFDEVGEDLDLVLDVGHSNISGQTVAFVESFGQRIVHIHAHDNDGKHDLHLGVGSGTVDWRQFAEVVKRVGFTGSAIVESYQDLEESVAKLRGLLT